MKIFLILMTLLLSLQAQNIGASVYENIIFKNIQKATQNIKQLTALVENNASKEVVKEAFIQTMISWKKVEALYLAADLDEEYIDIPRYIDVFHEGKEDIYKQLDRILRSSDRVEIALFKNSTKSINALEYLLFKPSQKTQRQNEMLVYILKHMDKHLKTIEVFYHDNQALFKKDEKKLNAIIMNALIESSYKLKEWRVGDPAGLSRKYKNDAKDARSEYPISELSYKAIEAILLTHQAMIGKQKFVNFSKVIVAADAEDELFRAQNNIKNALKYLQLAKGYDFSSKEIQALYKELTELHNVYFISLITALKISSKILDSDGD